MVDELSLRDFYPAEQKNVAEAQKQKTTLKQILNTQTPLETTPNKIDVILDLIAERDYLKSIREKLAKGKIKADKNLTAEMYIAQIIISADKAIIEALKENNITINQNTIDITTQVNELISFSREKQCNRKHTAPS